MCCTFVHTNLTSRITRLSTKAEKPRRKERKLRKFGSVETHPRSKGPCNRARRKEMQERRWNEKVLGKAEKRERGNMELARISRDQICWID